MESQAVTHSEDPIDGFANPEVQISGKIPGGDTLDDGIADTGASRAQVSQTNGEVILNVTYQIIH